MRANNIANLLKEPIIKLVGYLSSHDWLNITKKVSESTIQAKFHNPLEAEELFKECVFKNIKIHFYHFHAAYPLLETDLNSRKLMRQASIDLEGSDNWKGNFLCSAYLVEAIV